MLRRILGEVLIGLLIAAPLLAVLAPAATRAGLATGPWLAWLVGGASVAICVAVGERRYKRRQVRESP